MPNETITHTTTDKAAQSNVPIPEDDEISTGVSINIPEGFTAEIETKGPVRLDRSDDED